MGALDWASSSAASTTGSSSYDVFLSFRGEDTRNNFTGFLNLVLKDRGINVFFDSEKLWTGEAIGQALLRAIEGSKISIPVFSKGYAQSKWCLSELAQIVQCHRSNDQMVLPIFFYVEPSHVRNQTGSFAEAFREHEKNFESHIIESWRESLKVVGNLKGIVLNETSNQAKIVDLVAKRALGELISRTHLAECKHQIGIESNTRHMLTLLNIDSDDVQFVGICGFGGIGKTTIAKAVYNRILVTFNKHCFLSDIRERALQYGLVSLQKRLVKDIFKTDFDIDDYHIGTKLIEDLFRTEKVLLVLDDVDSQEQINALAGELNWFGKGSRVIITTRDEHILNLAKVDKEKIYWPQELDHNQSLQLFSLHAFKRDQPPENYMQLSRDVACYSRGLPLTLEVFGFYLSDISNKEEWESTLQKLKEIPPEKVQRRLKISYDNLEDDYQKAIFLDAACFFIGWKKETVISIWEACGYYPKSAIYRLIRRSLIKFECDEEGQYSLKMHDQIPDMGREIVKAESPMEPGRRSRLWSYNDILEVLEGHKGTSMIKGMSIPYALPWDNLAREPFQMMLNLRFLDISSANFTGDFFHLPPMLRCFVWNNFPWRIIPINFYHNRLVYLNMSGSKIEKAWNVKPQGKIKFQMLKVLDLSECRYLSKCPNFSWFPYLEQLDLENCNSLDKLDESIGQLNQLKSLILIKCWKIKELPKSIGDLKSLAKLDLSLTQMEELPDSISRLTSLKDLILKECILLMKLPGSIGDLKSLVELRLCDCYEIEDLPDGIGLLENLEVLDVEYCWKLVKLPRSMGRMRSLHNINLKGTRISILPDDFSMLSNLVELKMSGMLQSLPADLSHLKNLKQLEICECEKLEYLPELPSSLVEFYCVNCHSLVRLPDMLRLVNLTKLWLKDCEKLEEIRGLEGIKSLEELDAPRCYNLTHTPRKINGQGTLLPNRSQRESFSLTTDDGVYNKGLILCLVLKFHSCIQLPIYLDISASISRKDKTIRCSHTLRIEDVEFSTHQDIIYIHHFKSFDWFGIPLQGKDALEILYIHASYPLSNDLSVKFWEVLFENRVPDQQNPNQHSSAMMVADFFNWSYVNDNGEVISLTQSLTCWSVEGSNSVPKKLEAKGACVDDEDEEALNDASNQQTLDQPSHVQEKGIPLTILKKKKKSRGITIQLCFGCSRGRGREVEAQQENSSS